MGIKAKKIKLLVFFIALLALLLFLWIKQGSNQAAPNNFNQASAPEVSVVKVKKQSVELFQELPARVAAYRISEVRPRIEGVIKEVKFVEGGFVQEGLQLYQVDPNIYQIALDDANGKFQAALAKKNRYKNLLQFDAISKQEYDDAKAAFAQADAEVKRAKTNLTYTKVLAPISGYIGKTNVTEGKLVTANQAEILTTITQLDPIYVDMAQPSKDMIGLGDQSDARVSLIVDGVDYEGEGVLKFSEVFADEATDSVRLRAKFSNENKKLIPGMFVTAKLHLKPIEAILVPQRAASRGADGNLTVWVVDKENIAKIRSIKAEKIFKDNWVVVEGLQEDEVVIYEGFQKIADGAKVNALEIKDESTQEGEKK